LIQNELDANLTYSNRVGKFASNSLCVKVLDSISPRVLQLPRKSGIQIFEFIWYIIFAINNHFFSICLDANVSYEENGSKKTNIQQYSESGIIPK
jgi:hypothetical protein